jgi:hypothetical protein
MPSRLSLTSGFILVLFFHAPGRADDSRFGDLDFTRLSKPQEQLFWECLKALAVEEAAITYCGQPDDFELRAKQGIRSCVTADALNKAQSFFESEMKGTINSFRERRIACNAIPEATSGWLGIYLSSVGKGGSNSPGVGSGALVAGALDDSPAAAADLKPGDVITSVNGENIAGPKELSAKIRVIAPGTTVQLGVLRDGAGHSVSVKLGAMAFDRQGKIALDMPALIASSKQDLKSVSDQVIEMCQKCKTSIWAMFCH